MTLFLKHPVGKCVYLLVRRGGGRKTLRSLTAWNSSTRNEMCASRLCIGIEVSILLEPQLAFQIKVK